MHRLKRKFSIPAVKRALKDKELIPEARVEHDTLKGLIAQVEGEEPDGEMFDAKIKVMREYVKHHVKEEQDEIFPKAKVHRPGHDGAWSQAIRAQGRASRIPIAG